MWKHRILYAVLVVSALSAYIAADRGEALVLLCMLVFVPFFSVALQAAAMRGIGISCRVQEICRMGQEVSVYFEVCRKSRLPLGAVWIHAVLFDESLSEDEILTLGEEISKRPEIKEMRYVSAAEAWDVFKADYFAGREELAEGFADDNPLAGSASYEIFLYDIAQQELLVQYLEGIAGIRQVNYSSTMAAGFSAFNKVIGVLSLGIIGVLLAVAVFLINNTISVTAAFRRRESEITRLIGATNFMIRAPFIVEGVLIGLIGAAAPLIGVYFLYTRGSVYLIEPFQNLFNKFDFIPIWEIYPVMIGIALILGVGIGFFGSFFTIRKSLRV